MADEGLNNTPSSINPGPPPTGGGSFDSEKNSSTGTEKDSASANDNRASLTPRAGAIDWAFQELSHKQNLAAGGSRRKLDELKLRHELELAYQAFIWLSDSSQIPNRFDLHKFYMQHQRDLESLYLRTKPELDRGIFPISLRTKDSALDLFRQQGLFGLKKLQSQDDDKSSQEKNDTKESKESSVGETAAKATMGPTGIVMDSMGKTLDAVIDPFIGGGKKPDDKPLAAAAVPPPTVSKPQDVSSQPAGPLGELDDDDDSQHEPEVDSVSATAPGLASAARSGLRIATPPPALSKRAAKRQRGKVRASKQKTVKAQASGKQQVATDESEVSAQGLAKVSAQSYSPQVSSQEDAEITAEAAAQGVASAVTSGSQVSAAVAAAAKVKAEVKGTDDTLTPGFAEGKGGGSATAGQTTRLIQEGDEGGDFITPTLVQPKSRGAQSAKGETIGIETGEADQIAFGGRKAGSNTAQSAVIGKRQAGTAQSARPTAEAEEEAAEAAVVARGSAQAGMKGGVDAEIEEEETAEKESDTQEQPKVGTKEQIVPEKQQEESTEKKAPSDDFVRSATEPPKPKREKGRGGEGKVEPQGEEGVGQDEGLQSQQEQQPGEQQDQPGQETSAGDDFRPPQFGPGEYQTEDQKAQIAKKKRASVAKDKERDARRGKKAEEDQDTDQSKPVSDGQALDRFDQMNPAEQLAHINQWLGKTSQKKKRVPSIGGLKLRLLETAALKYPELKELLDEIKAEAYKAAHGLSDLPGRRRKERSKSMEDEFWFWVEKVFAEYLLKTWLFPYLTISAFFDGGIQAILALIALHIYWFIGMIFKDSGVWQGLLRWQKWLLAGIDILVGLIILFVVLVGIYGFCQLPGVGIASKAASLVTSDITYTFCNDLNAGITNISNSPAGQNLAPAP